MEFSSFLPKELTDFLLVVLFSLIIGLEQRRLHIDSEPESLFGTDRTLTLVGILGFILYSVMPATMTLFIGGGIVLAGFLGIYYFNKMKIAHKWGLTSIMIALITYSLTPLVVLQPLWMVMLVVVTILIVVEMKESLFNFSKKFDRNEFTLLAKFIIIAGIVLPLLPHAPISDFIQISPYQIWISIVAVTGISYLSYLLRKFAFPDSGILLSSILGGLYSSTATTLILARQSKTEGNTAKISAGIIGATGIMYIRLLILAFIFNTQVAFGLLPYFIVLLVVNFMLVNLFIFKHRNDETPQLQISSTHNPLEFKTALIFGLLFAFFAVLTNYVVANYGNMGVSILSFIVGVTDIDPYILNLFQSTDKQLIVQTIVHATVIATASNNLIKMIYAIILGEKSIYKNMVIGFGTLTVISLLSVFIF